MAGTLVPFTCQGLYLHDKGLARDFEKFETKPFLSVTLHSPTPPTDLPKSNSITPIRRTEFCEVAGNLNHPWSIRLARDSSNLDSSRG